MYVQCRTIRNCRSIKRKKITHNFSIQRKPFSVSPPPPTRNAFLQIDHLPSLLFLKWSRTLHVLQPAFFSWLDGFKDKKLFPLRAFLYTAGLSSYKTNCQLAGPRCLSCPVWGPLLSVQWAPLLCSSRCPFCQPTECLKHSVPWGSRQWTCFLL